MVINQVTYKVERLSSSSMLEDTRVSSRSSRRGRGGGSSDKGEGEKPRMEGSWGANRNERDPDIPWRLILQGPEK